MMKNMDKERKLKEQGAKIYEVILNLFAIVGLVMAADGSELLQQYAGVKLLGPTGIWWGWLILTFFALMRLVVLSKLKVAASNSGKLLTEFTDELQKERNKNQE